MIYKFKSKSGADIIMMQPNGDEVLRLLGKEPAPTGIIEPADMPAAIQALEAAIAEADDERDEHAGQRSGQVTLRQRAWPLVEMMKRAQGAGHAVVWGV